MVAVTVASPAPAAAVRAMIERAQAIRSWQDVFVRAQPAQVTITVNAPAAAAE